MAAPGQRRVRRSFRLLLAVAAASPVVFSASCGPTLSSTGVIETVRILGLRKSAPYARPGEEIHLELLWDGPGSARVQRFFGYWCTNPAGDQFAACLNGPPSITPRFVFNEDTFDLTIPEDIVQGPEGEGVPAHGLAVVFYGVCAGQLAVGGRPIDDGFGGNGGEGGAVDSTERNDIPTSGTTDGRGNFNGLPTCIDESGAPVDSDGFVVGYSQIFAYRDFRNENPRLLDFEVNGESVQVDCYDEDCVGRSFEYPELDGCAPGVACFQTCVDDGAMTCPSTPIVGVVDPASVEADEIALASYGTELEEGLWISYFTDRGSFSSDLRLVNDATTGWNEDQSTGFRAPSEPGPVRIWAVVRDNRGGMAWVRIPGFVEKAE